MIPQEVLQTSALYMVGLPVASGYHECIFFTHWYQHEFVQWYIQMSGSGTVNELIHSCHVNRTRCVQNVHGMAAKMWLTCGLHHCWHKLKIKVEDRARCQLCRAVRTVLSGQTVPHGCATGGGRSAF